MQIICYKSVTPNSFDKSKQILKKQFSFFGEIKKTPRFSILLKLSKLSFTFTSIRWNHLILSSLLGQIPCDSLFISLPPDCHLLPAIISVSDQKYFLRRFVKIFVFQAGSSWVHVSGQNVSLQNSTLLHLLEIERVYLQKQAQVRI